MTKESSSKMIQENVCDFSHKLSHLRVAGNIGNICYPKNSVEVVQNYKEIRNICKQPFPLGAGSNTLIGHLSDIVLVSDKYFQHSWDYDKSQNLILSSNHNINFVIMQAAKQGFGGLEFLAGIPAHLGGLVYMNAGAEQKVISDFVQWIYVADEKGEKRYNKDDIEFGYRNSNINGFITKICLKLQPLNSLYHSSKSCIVQYLELVKQKILNRKAKQPLNTPNLGCFFKNTPNHPAGYLIEQAGLKSFRIGGAMVSPIHANFLVNIGKATFEDFMALIDHVRTVVHEKFNITLDLEVRVING